MPNEKTDKGGFSTTNADQERDIAAKGGGASLGTGIPDSKHAIVGSYDADLQTQIAAKGKKKSSRKDNTPAKTNDQNH